MFLYLFAPPDQSLWNSGGLNSVIASGIDEAAAREAVLDSRPNGAFDERCFASWDSHILATGGTITDSPPQYFGRCYSPRYPNPGA